MASNLVDVPPSHTRRAKRPFRSERWLLPLCTPHDQLWNAWFAMSALATRGAIGRPVAKTPAFALRDGTTRDVVFTGIEVVLALAGNEGAGAGQGNPSDEGNTQDGAAALMDGLPRLPGLVRGQGTRGRMRLSAPAVAAVLGLGAALPWLLGLWLAGLRHDRWLDRLGRAGTTSPREW